MFTSQLEIFKKAGFTAHEPKRLTHVLEFYVIHKSCKFVYVIAILIVIEVTGLSIDLFFKFGQYENTNLTLQDYGKTRRSLT